MFPRTRRIAPILTLLALAACGSPPSDLPDSPSYVPPSSLPVATDIPVIPTATTTPPLITPTTTYVPPTTTPATPATTVPGTTGPATIAATPTPSHAPKCAGAPTAAQILAAIKGLKDIPDKKFKVTDGPYCSGTWSFSTIEVDGDTADQIDPLMVLTTGKDTTLTVVAAGSDVCNTNVQTTAPAGIRVLACGF